MEEASAEAAPAGAMAAAMVVDREEVTEVGVMEEARETEGREAEATVEATAEVRAEEKVVATVEAMAGAREEAMAAAMVEVKVEARAAVRVVVRAVDAREWQPGRR